MKSTFLKKKHSTARGFLLVEMIVSVAIFVIVMMIAYGALLVLVGINANVQSFQTSLTNVSFAVDSMTRNIRTGRDYYCKNLGSIADDDKLSTFEATSDCSPTGKSGIVFTDHESGDRVGYRLNNGSIERKVDDYVNKVYQNKTTEWIRITAPIIQITKLEFVVEGTDPWGNVARGDTEQPTVLMEVEGHGKEETKIKSDFHLQMFITQRLLDI